MVYKVLIVEDDPMVAMINGQYIAQNQNFCVSAVCRDGESALSYLEHNSVSLVILDVYMPRIDGLSLLRKIRENNIPVSVIMVTAANDSTTVEEALRLGIVDYMIKPFNNDRFQRALESFLNRQNALQESSSLDQRHIDMIIGASRSGRVEQLPKGIQDNTLSLICDFLRNSKENEFTSEYIADKVGLSRVTVRRYMNFLLDKSNIIGRMNYDTGGRPCMLYRWNIQ